MKIIKEDDNANKKNQTPLFFNVFFPLSKSFTLLFYHIYFFFILLTIVFGIMFLQDLLTASDSLYSLADYTYNNSNLILIFSTASCFSFASILLFFLQEFDDDDDDYNDTMFFL